MQDFLARCQPLEIIALLAVLAGTVVGVVGLLAWRQVRLRQAEATLKQEAVRKGLSVTEIRQLLQPDAGLFFVEKKPRTDAEAVQEVARALRDLAVSGPEIEHSMVLLQATNSATRQAVAAACDGMFEEGNRPDKEQLLAVIRGMCEAVRRQESGAGSSGAIIVEPFAATDRPRE